MYNWLTKKYQLIIRNEADFSEKTTISYNYGKAIMFFFFMFTVSAVVGFFCIRYVELLFSEKSNEKDLGQEIVRLSNKVDSLEVLTNDYRVKDESFRVLMGLLKDDKLDSLK
jgi:hypothetical protein